MPLPGSGIISLRTARQVNRNHLSSQGVFGDTNCYSCEGRNPENSVPSKMDAPFAGKMNRIPRSLNYLTAS